MRKALSLLFVVLFSTVLAEETSVSWQEIAERAVREAAEKAARSSFRSW